MKDKDVYKKIVEEEPYCRLCGSTSYLHIHHIYYRSQGGLTIPENLIRLCDSCHKKVHSNKDHFQRTLLEMQTKKYGEVNPENLIRRNKWISRT